MRNSQIKKLFDFPGFFSFFSFLYFIVIVILTLLLLLLFFTVSAIVVLKKRKTLTQMLTCQTFCRFSQLQNMIYYFSSHESEFSHEKFLQPIVITAINLIIFLSIINVFIIMYPPCKSLQSCSQYSCLYFFILNNALTKSCA